MKGQVIGTLFEFLWFFFLLLLAVFLITKFFNFLPVPTNAPTLYTPLIALYTFAFTLIDNSFIFFFVISMVMDVVLSYLRPSALKGFANIVLLFSMAFLSLFIKINLFSLGFLNGSTAMPNTYAFFNNDWYLIITLFALAISIIFNFRGKK